MTTQEQRKVGLISLALLACIFIAAIMASNSLLRGVRIDLTENNLFTISDGTRELLASIEEPINLYLFFSDEATADIPYLRGYANRVRETLDEFARVSNGSIVVHDVDPAPFSEEEDRAAQFGLNAISLGSLTESVYFGLAGTNSVGDEDTIPFLQPEKETFLEYDLAKLVYNLANPVKPVVGLISGASMSAGFNPQTQQMTEAWAIMSQAQQLFEIRELAVGVTEIDEDIGVLWIVHPRALSEATLYAIDQFVLGGGRALIFVDPFAEIEMSTNDPATMAAGSPSTLGSLFEGWGIQFDLENVVADDRYALAVGGGLGAPVRHIGLIGLDEAALNSDDIVTSGLGSINLGTAGHFTLTEGSETTLVPLIMSSAASATMPTIQFQFLSDPSALLNGFMPTDGSYVLAARLEGSLNSAFPDGPPVADAADADEDAAGPESAGPPEGHLASTDSANVILVGDVDVLSDRLWVQRQNFFGQQLVTAFANNGDFVINSLDNLSGSAALIGIRARASYSRPFTRVDDLRRAAEAEFRATEQRLQAELADTEQRLAELQAERSDGGSLLMSDEQQAEIERFLDEQIRIRQELRAVQRNLDLSIEQLGTRLKIINIGLVPLLLTIVALVFVVYRRREARASS